MSCEPSALAVVFNLSLAVSIGQQQVPSAPTIIDISPADYCKHAKSSEVLEVCREGTLAESIETNGSAVKSFGGFKVGQVFKFTPGHGTRLWVHDADNQMVNGGTCYTDDGDYELIGFDEKTKQALLMMKEPEQWAEQKGGLYCPYYTKFFLPVSQMKDLHR